VRSVQMLLRILTSPLPGGLFPDVDVLMPVVPE
jgi:hypothetical protein